MGGVNIPLEANNLRIPAPIDPLEEFARASALKTAAGEQQVQQQQVQGMTIANQQAAQAQKDQAAMTQALQSWDGKSYDDLPSLVLKHGGSANAVFGVQQQLLARKTQIAQLDKDTLANQQAHNDAALGALKAASDVSDDQLSDHISKTIPSLLQQGHITPQQADNANQVAQLAATDPKAARDHLSLMEKTMMGEKEQFSQAQTAQENTTKQQEANAKDWQKDDALGIFLNTRTGEIKSPAGQVMSPAMLESKYVMNQATKARTGQSPDPAFDKGYEKLKTLVPVANFNLQAAGVGGNGTLPAGPTGEPLSYEDQIKSFGPKGGVVKAIIEGRQDPPASFAQKSPYWQDVMQKVYAIDPEFNQQRAQLRKDYTVGKHSTEINAINTATGHLGELNDAIDALNNGNIPLLNKIANSIGVQLGETPQTTLQTIVHRVGPEISKAYLGAGGSAGERGADEQDFSSSKGNDQLKANAAITAKLLRSKVAGLENQWDQNKAPSMPSFQDQFISKQARAVLDKLSPQGGSSSVPVTRIYQGATYAQQPDGSWKKQ